MEKEARVQAALEHLRSVHRKREKEKFGSSNAKVRILTKVSFY